MDKLIKREGEFVYLAIAEGMPREKQEIEATREILEGVYATWLRLAEYEDIGLEPAKIRELFGKLEEYEWKYGSAETAMDYAEYAGKLG